MEVAETGQDYNNYGFSLRSEQVDPLAILAADNNVALGFGVREVELTSVALEDRGSVPSMKDIGVLLSLGVTAVLPDAL